MGFDSHSTQIISSNLMSASTSATSKNTLTIDGDRLSQSISQLAEIGRLADGSIRRIAFSPEDMAARQWVIGCMKEAGMSVRVDPAGNIIGRYPGQNPNAAALATGSHIDTVPTGGCFDGTLGVLAGIEIARTLKANSQQFYHPFETIVFTDEENSIFGSKAIAGRIYSDPNYYRRSDGRSIESCLTAIGGDWLRVKEAQRQPGEIKAFVELHVEQGPVLETVGKPIGIVEGIVAQRRYILTVQGRSSHAGTTPMTMRQDALVAASRFVLAVNELGQAYDPLVATVGSLTVYPNAPNVIASGVELSIDLRDISDHQVETITMELQNRSATIAEETQTQIHWKQVLTTAAAPATVSIQQTIAKACQNQGLDTFYLPSRAGHDAQDMAAIADMGMIFVPSVGGISHSAQEYTTPQQCQQGANVLLETLLLLDQQ
ncbi:MAG: Zn-dependent hydrolase [Microcoleaceae cyanobacterium]